MVLAFLLLLTPVRAVEFHEAVGKDSQLFIEGGKWKNVFQVGEEVKLLPELMSNLDFSPKDHAKQGDLQAENQLHEKSHWGRIYIDGWPEPLQYLRAHFGLPTPNLHRMPLLVAEPWDACSPLNILDTSRPAVVLAGRGTCTFGTKANMTANAFNGTQVTLVLVNNEPGAIHAPGPDAHDVQASVAMISQDDGEHLLESIQRDDLSLTATMVPVNCVQHSETRKFSNNLCDIVTTKDSHFVTNDLNDGGVVLANGKKFEYLLANFGTAVPPRSEPLSVVRADPEDACTPLLNHTGPNTAIVVTRGGGCGFMDKVLHAQAAGASAVLIANAHSTDRLLRPSCHPRWLSHNVSVPVVHVSKLARDALRPQVVLQPLHGGHLAAWDRIALLQDQHQPLSSDLLDDLALADWPDRRAWLSSVGLLPSSDDDGVVGEL